MSAYPEDPKQFSAMVRERHGNGGLFGPSEFKAMTDQQYNLVLNDVAHMQRANPEHAMDRIQERHSGVYSGAVEHIGDLSHRMQEPYATKTGYSLEYVSPKVERMHDLLHHAYGFEREMGEQVTSNAKYAREKGKPEVSADEIRQLGQNYADEHSKLPAYNRPSLMARESAVALGEHRFDDTRMWLRGLKRTVGSPERYREQMGREGAIGWLEQQ